MHNCLSPTLQLPGGQRGSPESGIRVYQLTSLKRLCQAVQGLDLAQKMKSQRDSKQPRGLKAHGLKQHWLAPWGTGRRPLENRLRPLKSSPLLSTPGRAAL
ncbi:hypothetical protein VULLAG_LOCUS14960 [Vulpes lagopus]